jgi:hypothetical protein
MNHKEMDGSRWMRFIWLRNCVVIGCCEHSNEASGSIKDKKCLDQLSDCSEVKVKVI